MTKAYLIPLTVAFSRANAAIRGSTQITATAMSEAICSLQAATAENCAEWQEARDLARELIQIKRDMWGL